MNNYQRQHYSLHTHCYDRTILVYTYVAVIQTEQSSSSSCLVIFLFVKYATEAKVFSCYWYIFFENPYMYCKVFISTLTKATPLNSHFNKNTFVYNYVFVYFFSSETLHLVGDVFTFQKYSQ